MLYAVDEHGNKIRAYKNGGGWCPTCNNKLIAKCGRILIDHWSHRSNELLCNYKNETEWHLKWKLNAVDNGHDVEVRIGKHITDIINLNSKRLIELQNSNISVDDIIDRCEVFKQNNYMVDWIFNLNKKFLNYD